jgi:sugar phosphate isomerase/epimerase
LILGYNTNGLAHHRLDDGLRLLADEGFGAVALTPDVAHLDPYRSTAAEVERIAALLARLDMTCVVEAGARYLLDSQRKHWPTLLEDGAADREVRVDFLRRCIRLAEQLGSDVVSFWAGRRPPGCDPAAADERLDRSISALLAEAGERGVVLALEPEPGMYVETVAEGLEVLRRLGDGQELTLTVDIGHLYVTGEGDPGEVLPRAAGRISQVHVEDMCRGVHEHLPPGEGDVEFPAVWRALEAAAYAGPVCFELSRSSHAAPEMLCLAKQIFHAR